MGQWYPPQLNAPVGIEELVWFPFNRKSLPPKSTCFYSDGVSYWAGWYSTDEGECIYIKAGEGTDAGNARMTKEDFARVRFWAHPGNVLWKAMKQEKPVNRNEEGGGRG